MRKSGSGMVALGDYLGVFGGYGEPQGPTQPGSFIKSRWSSNGWTNEFHIYHLKEGWAKQSQSSLSYLPVSRLWIFQEVESATFSKRLTANFMYMYV